MTGYFYDRLTLPIGPDWLFIIEILFFRIERPLKSDFQLEEDLKSRHSLEDIFDDQALENLDNMLEY